MKVGLWSGGRRERRSSATWGVKVGLGVVADGSGEVLVRDTLIRVKKRDR